VPQAEVPLEVLIQEQMLLQWGELNLQYKAPQLSHEFTVDANSLQFEVQLCISRKNFKTSLLFRHLQSMLDREETPTLPS
jgi:hypothetical protein